MLIQSLVIISINAWGMNYSLMEGSQRKYHALSSAEIVSNDALLMDLTNLFRRYNIDAKDIKSRICESKIDLNTMWSEQYFFDLYLQKLQELVEYTISPDQIELLKAFYVNNDDKNPSSDRRKKIKEEFYQKKSALIEEWKHKYAREWPNYSIEEKEGMSKVKSMTAHHIIPREAGGINEWWNIAPLSMGHHMIIHQCSAEERACFSRDFVEREFFRIFLKIKTLYPTTERSDWMTLEKVLSEDSQKKIYEAMYSKKFDQSIVIDEDCDDTTIPLLMGAIINNAKEYVRKTIKQGIDINSKNKEGDTLLIIAVKNKRKTIAKMLLKYGADLLIKSHDGKTPLQIAEEKGYKRIAEILREYKQKNRSKY